MKSRQKHIILALCACVLALCSLCGSVFAVGTNVDLFDYGRAGVGSNETLDALTVFERLFGTPTTEAERTYLDELSTMTLTYNSAIPDSQINTVYDKDASALDVTLSAYTFTAANGAVVSWIPKRAHFEDLNADFVLRDGVYSCRFSQLENYVTGDFEMSVDFTWTVELPIEAASTLLNEAYQTGYAALHGQILPYEQAYADYTKELIAYLAWQAYLDAVEEYRDYQAARDAYNTAMDAYRTYLALYDDYITGYYQEDQKSVAVKNAYNTYVTAYDTYLQKAAACEQLGNADEANAVFAPASGKYEAVIATIKAWEAWEAYQDFKTNHLEEYNNYLLYCAQIEKVTAKLKVLETLFVTDSHGWQLYASLLGNTVATVVERKGELIAAGCSEADINAAGDSTVILREVMQGYADLRAAEYESEHARTAALYAYYTQHYTTLRTQYAKLYGALKSLYGNSLVVANLSAEGKLEHYQQFVGQLYVTTVCLDDSTTYLSTWSIGKKSLSEVVEPIQLLSDGIADPTVVSMPETEVPRVEFVEEAVQPTVPQPKDTPIAPVLATGLVNPVELTDPSLGTIPPEVQKPDGEPQAPVIDPRVRALAEDVRANRLTARDIGNYSRTLTLSKTVSRLVSIDNRKVVTFWSHDGKQVLDRQTVEYGTTVRYRGDAPLSYENEREKVEFIQWVLEDKTSCDMVVYGDMALYADCAVSVRHYPITFVLDGEVRVVENVAYGEIPKVPFDLSKTEDEAYTYTFSGWSPEVVPVTGQATYTGSVTKTPKLFTVTWELGDRIDTTQVPYGDYAVYEGTPRRAPDACAYTFLSWDRSLDRVTGDVTYTALYDAVPFAKATDGTVTDAVHGDGTLTLLCERTRLDIRNAAEYALANGVSLILQWSDFSLCMERTGLEAFCASTCRQIRLTVPDEDGYGRVYTLGYCNNIGETMELAVPVTLFANADTEGNERSLFLRQNDAWTMSDGEGVAVNGGATIRVTDLRWISVKPVEHCFLSHIPSNAGAGVLIDLNVNCEFGYEVSGARVTMEDGTVIPVDGLCFYMPDGNVSIELTVSRIVYHVSFVSDGEVIFEADYFLGDPIVIPQAPVKASDGVYDYVFSGWSRDVTIAFGDERNPVIEAVWSATPVLTYDPYQSGNNNNVFMTIVLPIIGGVALLGVAVFLTLRYLKKRKAPIPNDAIVECDEIEAEVSSENETEIADSPVEKREEE